jgi:hypothetical protein
MLRFTLAAAAALAATAHVYAQEHRHPGVTYDGATAQFYETWMRPDMPNVSCCNLQDCAPVRHVRQRPDGRWSAQREIDGQWLDVPPEKIEAGRDSPDGRSHLCSIGTTVLCFVVGVGG